MNTEMLKEIETYKNEKFILTCLDLLDKAGKLDEYMIGCLTDGSWCLKNEFMDRDKPILKEIPLETTAADLRELIKDGTSQSRYYASTKIFNGKKYMITNYWYGPRTKHKDNRTPFLDWIRLQLL